jgi:REP element-mobilizing transposase RayT
MGITNHVHLLATPETDEGVSQMMQALGRYYVRYFNKRHKRSGTLWEGRFLILKFQISKLKKFDVPLIVQGFLEMRFSNVKLNNKQD